MLVGDKIKTITERFPELRESILDTLYRWHEPHRHWHGISHLTHCVERSMEMSMEYDRVFYTLVSLYHDAVYDPTRTDNEEASAELVPDFSIVVDGRELTGESIRLAVLQTKDDIHTAFNRIDRDILKTESIVELLEYEKGIFMEFQHCALSDYVKGRCDFLRKLSNKWITDDNRNALIEYVTNKTYRIGIYAGSFDPFHVGHNDIRLQAEKHFDKVVVALGTNGSKSYSPDRLDNVRRVLPHTQVLQYYGLVSELCTNYTMQAKNVEVTLVRGLRNITDLQSEQNIRAALNDDGGVKTMYFMCDQKHQHVSSSLIREMRSFGRSADKYLVNTCMYNLNINKNNMTRTYNLKEPNHLDFKVKNKYGEWVWKSPYAMNRYADEWEAWHNQERLKFKEKHGLSDEELNYKG